MADKIEILYLNNETSQAAGGRAQQQPIYVSDTEELLEISDVAEIPPQDNHFVLENSGVFLNTNQPDHSCYLQLRKPFQRLLVREWFYSNIDQCLLGRGSGVQDMETLLSSQLPALVTRRLNRAAWNHIRDILRKLTLVQPRRRCSEKFFLDERMHLEQRREKVRFLQLHPMFEYLDDDLPADLPVGIESGDSVVAQLNEPYGVFRGVVEEVGGSYAHAYTVRFEDPEIDGQIVPDFQIASATPSSEPAPIVEEDAIVMIPQNLSKQLELFRDQLDEKEKLLNEMECLRLRFKSIRDRPETHQAQSMMRGQQRRYLNCIENLQTMNTSIGLHMRTITRLVDNVDDALVDTQVVQIAQRLQDTCCKAGNLPLGNGVLEITLRQLRGPPSRLNELQRYLQSRKFEQ
ncbi:hypothetical protein AND_009328 [Anopheles darlingi]|uniref:DIRP domain-containing protein n=1 Tax=Anopheles darlingi TaxID=43151 RepID=W5J6Q2_ANODA|nr:hypothetical protein AND_009328 [Anopheles darlingi]